MGRPSSHEFTGEKRVEINPFPNRRPDNFWWALNRNPFRLPVEQNCLLITLAALQGNREFIQITNAVLAKMCGFKYRVEKNGSRRVKIVSTPLDQAVDGLRRCGHITTTTTRSSIGNKGTKYSVRPAMTTLGYLPSGRPDPSWKTDTTITVPEWHEGCLDTAYPSLPPLEYPDELDELGLPLTPIKIGKPNYSSAPDVVY